MPAVDGPPAIEQIEATTLWSIIHRLRKYRRKKYNGGFNTWFSILYWRYHFKRYGKHQSLWNLGE